MWTITSKDGDMSSAERLLRPGEAAPAAQALRLIGSGGEADGVPRETGLALVRIGRHRMRVRFWTRMAWNMIPESQRPAGTITGVHGGQFLFEPRQD